VSSLLAEACEWAVSLRLADIPEDVRIVAEAQILSMLGAVHASLAHPVAEQISSPRERGEVGRGDEWVDQAERAAALSMALDFDETAFAGHLGHSSVLATLACAAHTRVGGERLLTAQVAAGEIAARITAAVTLGAARGQTAAHTHLAATAIGCGLVMNLDVAALEDALTLALANPRRVLVPAFMESAAAKCTVAAVPIRDAARSIYAAQAGVRGPRSIMDATGGLFDALADVALPVAMSNYGKRWHLRTMSLKHFPGCAYLSAAVDAACELAPLDLDQIHDVEVAASVFTVGMEAESSPFLRGPDSPLPALNFSVGYSLAAALEKGELAVGDFYGDPLQSEKRWRVASKTRLRHDRDLTVAALSGTAPVGAAIAWAGERARPYLAKRGSDEQLIDDVLAAAEANNEDSAFLHPSKRIGARLRIKLRDGKELRAERDAAAGSCQEPVADRLALAERKYLDHAGPRIGPVAHESRSHIASLPRATTQDLLLLWEAQRF